MQTAESLSFEVIPSRFCEGGDYEAIDTDLSDFSYALGWGSAFTDATFIQREQVNAVGRLGTSAQALLQAGGIVGFADGVEYGEFAVVLTFDGDYVAAWVSSVDGNANPPAGGGGLYYTVTSSADIANGLPSDVESWTSTSYVAGADFFDVS